MKTKKAWFIIVLLGIFGLVAGAEVIRTTDDPEYPGADTYVGNDSQVGPAANRGGDTAMLLRQNNESRSKTPYIRFNISEVAGDLSGAFLTFETTASKTSNKIVTVYGLTDETLDLWDELTINYNNAPAMLPVAAGFYDLDETKVVSLGTFMTPPGTPPPPVVFSTDPAAVNLTAFLNSDTNGLVTLFSIPTQTA
jgi:hypothetical protein